jgi:hypothetical protein
MERKQLESTAANYPFLQGLWVIPFGFVIVLAGISNLQHRPPDFVMLGVLVGGLLLSLVASLLIARYYRQTYGKVTSTRRRQVRQAVALVAWVVVLFVGGSRFLFWSLHSPLCVYMAAFALAMVVYYAILVGLRVHHLVIWGSLFIAGLLPIWGGLGLDRDAVAMFPLAGALIASGLLDQRLLVRAFESSQSVNLEHGHVGG